MRMIAMENFPYAGRTLRPGDEFDATERDADILEKIGKAYFSGHGTYGRRDMVAEQPMTAYPPRRKRGRPRKLRPEEQTNGT